MSEARQGELIPRKPWIAYRVDVGSSCGTMHGHGGYWQKRSDAQRKVEEYAAAGVAARGYPWIATIVRVTIR